jgi:hypothetical protein
LGATLATADDGSRVTLPSDEKHARDNDRIKSVREKKEVLPYVGLAELSAVVCCGNEVEKARESNSQCNSCKTM